MRTNARLSPALSAEVPPDVRAPFLEESSLLATLSELAVMFPESDGERVDVGHNAIALRRAPRY
jgi:hypothetical protein